MIIRSSTPLIKGQLINLLSPKNKGGTKYIIIKEVISEHISKSMPYSYECEEYKAIKEGCGFEQ